MGPLRLTALLLTAVLAGCGQQNAAVPETKPKEKEKQPHLVALAEVVREPIAGIYEHTGGLRARRLARIYNQEEGHVLDLPWFEGDRVKRGQLLLRLDDALLRAELDKAVATTRQASLDLKRIENLVSRSAASKDEQERSRTALDVAAADQRLLETRLSHMRIEAPFTGVVSERRVEPGDVISEHTHVLTLTDPSSLVTEVRVSELVLPHLSPGDPVEVRIDALGPAPSAGRILRIHPELDAATRQGVVEISLDPVPEGARAGQFARVTLRTAAVPRLLIPFAALQRDRDGEMVYRVDADSKARRTPVRSGLRAADRVEVLDGLSPGDGVVVRGFLGLADGKKVETAER